MNRFLLTVLGLSMWALGACGAPGVGATCSTEADPGQCSSDAYCAKTTAGALECLQVCSAQTDCPSTATCTGTVGSTKVCQPTP